MFTNKIKSALIAVTMAVGALAATGGAAQADGRGGVYISGGGIGIQIGSGHGYRRSHYNRSWGHGPRRDRWDRRNRRDRWDRGNRWDRPTYSRNRCSPRKAVRKARRKGLRNAHVVRVNRRGVIVAGRKWGDRVVIGFDRNRRCGVRFMRSRYR